MGKEVNKLPNKLNYIHQPYHLYSTQQLGRKQKPNVKFQEIFEQTIEPPKMSKHAKEMLAERNILIDGNQWEKISEKINEARKKGIQDSLVLTKDAALLISVKNNTVITALSRQETEAHIFTNIDGTIVIEE